MNKKEYSFKINGIEETIKSITSLEQTIAKLEKAIAAGTKASENSTKSEREKTKALTEEEKAAARLEQTKKKLEQADSALNREQIKATQQLRERNREISRQVAQEQLAEDSTRAMGMRLTDLRNEYELLSKAERENEEVGGALLKQIQELDAEYKAIRESTGNFRDSVGNYEKGVSGLTKLAEGLDKVDNAANGAANSIMGGQQLMVLFGATATETTETQERLAKVMLALSIAQSLSNAGLRESIKNGVVANVIDQVKIIQTNAKTLAENLNTRATWAGTVAQAAFNLVAKANPYVLLALALVALVAVLYTFVTETDKSAESQKKLNEQQKVFLEYLDVEASRIKQVSELRVKALERQLRVMSAQEGKTKQVRELEDQILKERRAANNQLLGFYGSEVDALEKNRAELEKYERLMLRVRQAEAQGRDKITIDIDLNGRAEKVDVDKAIESVQSRIDNLGKMVQIGIELKTEQADLLAEQKEREEQRKKEDREEAKRQAEEAKRRRDEAVQRGQERADLELDAQRKLEDDRLKLMRDGFEKQREQIDIEYRRQIEDIKIRLEREKNLTQNARASLNKSIVELEKVKNAELAKVDEEERKRNDEARSTSEDEAVALIKGQLERQRVEIERNYDKQLETLKEELGKQEDAYSEYAITLRTRITTAERLRAKELDALAVENLNRRAALELTILEENYKKQTEKIGDLTKRDKSGLIDTEATRAALKEQNDAMQVYFRNLVQYQNQLDIAGLTALAGLKEGTIEYEEEVQKQAQAYEDVNRKITDLLKKRNENEREQTRVTARYWADLFDKIAQYAGVASEAITGVTDTINMALQFSIDSLTEQLDTVDEFYSRAKDLSDEYAKNVETAEARVQAASGGTKEALKEQLQDAMRLRNEAQREEARLAKEKEKLEAEIKKREKQQKRAELVSNIGMGIANTAQGVTKALGTLPPPLSIVMAALVGALGLVQVGIMTRQLTKLAKGGPIKGPSHDNGGVDIMINGRPSYEAQGGEFMVNDASYAANPGLVEFINDNPRRLTFDDLIAAQGLDFAGVTNDVDATGNPLLEAIENIEIRPVVSVVDIQNATDQVTDVRDLSGF